MDSYVSIVDFLHASKSCDTHVRLQMLWGLFSCVFCRYSYAMKSLSNKYMHLTNYSINKRNQGYQSNADETQCQGHKW